MTPLWLVCLALWISSVGGPAVGEREGAPLPATLVHPQTNGVATHPLSGQNLREEGYVAGHPRHHGPHHDAPPSGAPHSRRCQCKSCIAQKLRMKQAHLGQSTQAHRLHAQSRLQHIRQAMMLRKPQLRQKCLQRRHQRALAQQSSRQRRLQQHRCRQQILGQRQRRIQQQRCRQQMLARQRQCQRSQQRRRQQILEQQRRQQQNLQHERHRQQILQQQVQHQRHRQHRLQQQCYRVQKQLLGKVEQLKKERNALERKNTKEKKKSEIERQMFAKSSRQRCRRRIRQKLREQRRLLCKLQKTSASPQTGAAEDLLSKREEAKHRIQRLAEKHRRYRSGLRKQQDSLTQQAQDTWRCPLEKLASCSEAGNASMCVEVFDSRSTEPSCRGAILVP